MLGRKHWNIVKPLCSWLMAAVLLWGVVGCGDRADSIQPSATQTSKTKIAGKLTEVAPPEAIQQLRSSLDSHQPQVSIVSPKADEVLEDTTVSVSLQVRDLPIFKDPDLGLGPHLHVILDNQPYKAAYDLNQPLIFEDLEPGTHTLRVFASRPWHESFKNDGAYAQTTFHVFTKSEGNTPDPALPLLTYSRPTGSYGAEPILLDFYLTNTPLHLVAQEDPNDAIADWRIRVTANGESFVLDRWQPIYLNGFNPGKNWIKLEFIDEKGNPVNNVYNNTVRLFNYDPKAKDTLAKLVQGDLSVEAARSIIDPNYKFVAPVPTPNLVPVPTSEPIIPETPAEPDLEVTPPVEPVPIEPSLTPEPSKPGFFNRFRRPEPSPSPTPEILETPIPEALPDEVVPPIEPDIAPIPEPLPDVEVTPEPAKPGFFNRFRRPEPSPSPTPEILETPIPEALPDEVVPSIEPDITPIPEPIPDVEVTPEPAKPGFFSRFRRTKPSPSPTPEILETPTPDVEVVPPIESTTPEADSEVTPTPESLPDIKSVPTETELVPPVQPPAIEKSKPGFFSRFRRAEPSPSPTPLPNIIEAPTPDPVPTVEPIAPDLPPTLPEIVPSLENPVPESKPSVIEEVREPKLDVKELLLPPSPGISPSPKLILPTEPEIPSRYLPKAVPAPSQEETKEESSP